MKKVIILVVFLLYSYTEFNAQSGNYALSFDGTNDYVIVPDDPSLNVTEVTIEMWFYWANSSVPNDVDFLIGRDYEELEIHTGGGSGNYGLRFIPTDGVHIDTDPNVFIPNQWTHIAFIYRPADGFYKCYLNGVDKHITKSSVAPATTPFTNTPHELRIGMRGDGSYPWEGMIDEVRIWRVVRTQQEIIDNMNIELTGLDPNLIAYYNMNEGSGSTLLDLTSNINDGSFVGNPTYHPLEGPLPVELTSFTANAGEGKVLLNWITATEVNNYGFEVERASLGTTPGQAAPKAFGESAVGNENNMKWEKIGFVRGTGNSNSSKEYSFIDANPANGQTLYRLKQINTNGSFTYYSNYAEVNYNLTNVNGRNELRHVPTEFGLDQNYPNPFNPSTTINYSIPKDAHVKLIIYDVLGRTIVTLADEYQSADRYSVKWNPSGISSGLYFYKLEVTDENGKDNFVSVKKLLLLK